MAASWLSRVSGGGWGSASTSASTVAGLPPDSYEEQLQKQKQHLTSRECYQVRNLLNGVINSVHVFNQFYGEASGQHAYISVEHLHIRIVKFIVNFVGLA